MLFDIPNRSDKAVDKAIISKANKKAKTVAKSIHGGLASRISEITLRVNQVLGKFRDKYIIIKDEIKLIDYINTCIENNVISIDTETTGLDPLQDDIVGICIYTPKSKAAYIPINHISYITNKKLDNQLSVETIRNAFLPMIENHIDIIMFNAVFDIRFLRNTIGLKDIYCTWDCYLASRLLNENEPQKGLKALHKKYVLKGKSDAFSFDELFKGITFNLIPIETAYLYAAHDPEITYELYEFQKPFLTVDNEVCIRKDLQGVAYVFHNIEMPCVQVVCDMEDNGIEFDFEYNKQLSEKYNKLLQESKEKFYSICEKYNDKIENYKLHNLNHGLENPININSPTQLSKLIYNILKLPQPQDKRSTGEDALKKIGGDLCTAILDYRTLSKLVDTYIDKLPNCVNPKDGRIHCNFNQYGADCITGESALLTSNGYMTMQSLFSGDEPNGAFVIDNTPVINREFKEKFASHRIVYYNTDTIKITLRGGYVIEGTPNHPIIVSDLSCADIQKNRSDRNLRRLTETEHFEKLENLKIGDTVAMPFGYNLFPKNYKKLDCKLITPKTHTANFCKMPMFCDEDFAEFLGMYHADGSYKESNGSFVISISNKDPEVISRVKYLANKLFGLNCTCYVGKTTIDTKFGSVQLLNLKKYLIKGARNKRVPEIIMKSPKSVICAYIRGMTLDSSLTKSRQRLRLNCVDEASYNFIKSALLNMGILTSSSAAVYTAECDHMGNNVGCKSFFRIQVTGEMYKKFLDEIGVIQSSKKLILPESEYNKAQYLQNGNCYYAYIKNIEHKKNTVYDLHIPDGHTFIANGLINHNTGRFSSTNPNLQNIPSHNKDIRKMFKAAEKESSIDINDNIFKVYALYDIMTVNGWKRANTIKVGDCLVFDLENGDCQKSIVTSTVIDGDYITFICE